MNFKKTTLNYSGQKLTELPKEIFEISRLHKLDLSNNEISVIPKEISQLRHLESINLTNNRIRSIYTKLFDLPNLKMLILNYNKIVNIPRQIKQLKNLKVLGLSNNKLTTLPVEIASLGRLEELNLSGNHLSELPLTNDAPFRSLLRLWVAHNPLNKVSSQDIVEKLPNLKSFYYYSPNSLQAVSHRDLPLQYCAKTKGNSISTLTGFYQNPDEGPVMARKDISSITSNMTTQPTAKKGRIFVSYSHADKEFLIKLKRHLKVLGHDVPIDSWDDTRIRSSENWKQEIEHALDAASDAILLVSTDFLASDFVRSEELPTLLKKAVVDGTRLHPVIVQPCRFLKTKSLSQFQASNSPEEPLSELSNPAQERIWLKLMDDIQFYLENEAGLNSIKK